MIRLSYASWRGLPALLGTLVLAVAATAATAPRILYQDDGGKPAGPVQPAVRTPFDCTARATLTLTPALWDTVITADTTGGPALVPGYGCRPWPEQGPEHIYRLAVTADLQLRAALSDLGTQDLDLFLLDDCDTDACLVGANTELAVVLTPGTWWLVVDGYGTSTPAAGPYTLTLETRWVGVPEAVCLPGGAVAVDCAGTATSLDGDLAGAPDLLQAYDCSPALLPGGEAWYALTVPGLHDLRARATPVVFAPTLDVALWLFDGCGASAVCLNFVDQRAGGQAETLAFANLSADAVTVYLAVDARRPPGEGDSGAFDLELACQSNVAEEKRPLGSVKALFR
jgi:hypothetical protein